MIVFLPKTNLNEACDHENGHALVASCLLAERGMK